MGHLELALLDVFDGELDRARERVEAAVAVAEAHAAWPATLAMWVLLAAKRGDRASTEAHLAELDRRMEELGPTSQGDHWRAAARAEVAERGWFTDTGASGQE
jgi:hypothetical protein